MVLLRRRTARGSSSSRPRSSPSSPSPLRRRISVLDARPFGPALDEEHAARSMPSTTGRLWGRRRSRRTNFVLLTVSGEVGGVARCTATGCVNNRSDYVAGCGWQRRSASHWARRASLVAGDEVSRSCIVHLRAALPGEGTRLFSQTASRASSRLSPTIGSRSGRPATRSCAPRCASRSPGQSATTGAVGVGARRVARLRHRGRHDRQGREGRRGRRSSSPRACRPRARDRGRRHARLHCQCRAEGHGGMDREVDAGSDRRRAVDPARDALRSEPGARGLVRPARGRRDLLDRRSARRPPPPRQRACVRDPRGRSRALAPARVRSRSSNDRFGWSTSARRTARSSTACRSSTRSSSAAKTLRVGAPTCSASSGCRRSTIQRRSPDRELSVRSSARAPRCAASTRLCERLAATNVPVIIEGETGTGKEVLAEALHAMGSRARGTVRRLRLHRGRRRTSSSPSSSGTSGVPSPARTYAAARRLRDRRAAGRSSSTRSATSSPSLQPKLLRALERSEMRRVGGEQAAPRRRPRARCDAPRSRQRGARRGASVTTSSIASRSRASSSAAPRATRRRQRPRAVARAASSAATRARSRATS